MATNLPTNVPTNQFEQFDSVAREIHHTFDPLIAELIARRDALLLRLSQLREDYTAKETTRRDATEEIEKAQQQMQEMTLKVNINIPIHQQAIDVYKQGLQQLETPTKVPYPLFECQTLNKLKSLISEFGEVVAWELPAYTLKKEPILTAGKYGSGIDELKAVGLAIDEDSQLIYIADNGNNRVQIVSLEGDFINSFGQETVENPWGIAVTKEHVYITDPGLHALLQFDKNSYQLVRGTGSEGSEDGQLCYPRGLCIDYNGDVLVADYSNNRVSVFSKELHFISNIGIEQLNNPRDVKLSHDGVVVVLDISPKCIHFYSKDGHLISSCISRGEEPDCLVNRPLFFCLDPAGNIIISDRGNHVVKIVSQSEELIHTIGREGEERGEFNKPCGICITKLGTILVVSDNFNYSIQSF